jgi:putative RecB family exonuclease
MPKKPAVRKFVISPTKLRVFNQCPAQYRLEYIERLGRFYHRARAGYSFGHTLHRALDAFHHAGGVGVVTADELSASLETLWVPGGYETAEQETAFRAEALRILGEYHAAEEQAAAQAAAAETPPAHLLWTEKTVRLALSPDVALSGRIDRVDEHADGTLEIVDYKSGRDTVDTAEVAESLALSLYQLLVKRAMPDRRVFATLVALRTGASASAELTAEALAALEAECLETGEIIRNKDWESVQPIPNDHCPYCDFLPHCERFWRAEALHA